jgi:hypothetical protein
LSANHSVNADWPNDVQAVPNVHLALQAVLARAAPEDLVCVTGSLFLAGEAILAAHTLGLAGP